VKKRIKANYYLKNSDDFFKTEIMKKAEELYRELIKIEETGMRETDS
jgi:hypothetical protein